MGILTQTNQGYRADVGVLNPFGKDRAERKVLVVTFNTGSFLCPLPSALCLSPVNTQMRWSGSVKKNNVISHKNICF
jgi:hypothetical protein